ncbi:CUB domain-containing protein 1 [Kryptolebias marmoratus]|uniref:CUB domain-containing protein n=1 Tax=Kryptolebias marmoratus TaxID=37003 RepID=A0A3Q3AKH7_KRYMA|nr:CUB domain-containing protein 1 [Kryptolebias marmoratus]
MRLCGTCALLLGLSLLTSLDSTESLQAVVRPNKGSIVEVSTKKPLAECAVCKVSGANGTQTSCDSSLSLQHEAEANLLFNCSQQSYAVTITETIDCTESTCSPQTVEVQSSILTEFHRTFIWELKAPEKIFVSLAVLGEGLVATSQPCRDGLQFSVDLSKANIKEQTVYCHGGSVSHFDLVSEAAVSLEVKPETQVPPMLFQASSGPLTKPEAVSIDPGFTVVLSRDAGAPECEVCVLGGSAPDCSATEKTLKSAEKISVAFRCLKSQDVFSVKMTSKIGCTKSSCTPAAAEVDPNLFKDFKRTIKWDINVPDRTLLSLDFPSYGLKDNSAMGKCQNGFQHTVSTTKYDGTIQMKTYCKDGTASKLENLLGATTVTVEVPKGGELTEKTAFNVKAAPRRGRTMSVTSDPNTIIIITKVTADPDCRVCVNEGSKQKCNPQTLRLTDPHNASVEFTCPQPQDVFNVEINREIDCTPRSCPDGSVHAENTFFPDFNRTFTWDLKIVSTQAVQLDFPEPGMRQISNEEMCPDDHTYSVIVYLRSGPANIGNFCKGGPVTTILALYRGRVGMHVPGNAKLYPVDFKLNAGPKTDKVATVKASLPRGVSNTRFITPNYPADFPDLQQIQWDFKVPGMHNYTVHFLDRTEPECLAGNVEVEYRNGKEVKRTLTSPQPQHQQGDFSMVLKNCQTNKTLQGLSLSYNVSVMRSGHPVLCTVDLTKHQGVSLHIQKIGSDPYCEISINSEVKDEIIMAAGTTAHLSFLDCPNDDIRLTASQKKIMTCPSGTSCPSESLVVPSLDSCLPMPLHSFTWVLNTENKTLDLVSPAGSLQQSLPGQECNRSLLLHVAQANGFSVGDFCSNGVIQKIQVRSNVSSVSSVSVMAMAPHFSKTREPVLNVSVSPKISETIIYRVNLVTAAPTLLASPNWPRGMRPYSIVSWIVAVPAGYQAHLRFVNVSQPKCKNLHASVKVQMLNQREELMTRREDEEIVDLTVPQSFYLNMSNCKPEEGNFSATVQIILQKKTNLLAILLGLAGGLLLLLTVLAVVCVLYKKKKRKKEADIFRPNDHHFIKARANSDSHVYDYIDGNFARPYLLDDKHDFTQGMQVDSYQTFTGPTDKTLPVINEPEPEPEMEQYSTFLDPAESFIPSRPRTPIGRQDSLGFQDRRLMDSELFTFKSTGDFNTIRLSGADLEPQPEETL